MPKLTSCTKAEDLRRISICNQRKNNNVMRMSIYEQVIILNYENTVKIKTVTGLRGM
jgi:hypothetical protein